MIAFSDLFLARFDLRRPEVLNCACPPSCLAWNPCCASTQTFSSLTTRTRMGRRRRKEQGSKERNTSPSTVHQKYENGDFHGSFSSRCSFFQWFLEPTDDPSAKKFSADLAYAEKRYPEAEKLYRDLATAAEGTKGSMTLLRDATEGVARCNIKMGRPEEAIEWAQKLVRLKSSFLTSGQSNGTLNKRCSCSTPAPAPGTWTTSPSAQT